MGSSIIDALIEGKSDVDQLMAFYHGKIKASKKDFGLALEGNLRPHHSQMLKIIKKSITSKEDLLVDIDLQIVEMTKSYSVQLENLQSIPGVGKQSAIGIISENQMKT